MNKMFNKIPETIKKRARYPRAENRTYLKNSIERFKSRLYDAEQRINNLEDGTTEII